MKIIDYKDLYEDFYFYKEFSGLEAVSEIIHDVKINGDCALKKYSKQFGDGEIENPELSREEIEKALSETPEEILQNIRQAVNSTKIFAEAQLSAIKEIEINNNGAILGHKIIPLERTGAYVPGGNYPLPSSAIMSVVPAKVAGVKEVIVCSPKIQNPTIAASVLA